MSERVQLKTISTKDFPTNLQALTYEAYGSWWVCLIPGDSKLGTWVSQYLAWKVNRRFRRIQKAIEWRVEYLKRNERS